MADGGVKVADEIRRMAYCECENLPEPAMARQFSIPWKRETPAETVNRLEEAAGKLFVILQGNLQEKNAGCSRVQCRYFTSNPPILTRNVDNRIERFPGNQIRLVLREGVKNPKKVAEDLVRSLGGHILHQTGSRFFVIEILTDNWKNLDIAMKQLQGYSREVEAAVPNVWPESGM